MPIETHRFDGKFLLFGNAKREVDRNRHTQRLLSRFDIVFPSEIVIPFMADLSVPSRFQVDDKPGLLLITSNGQWLEELDLARKLAGRHLGYEINPLFLRTVKKTAVRINYGNNEELALLRLNEDGGITYATTMARFENYREIQATFVKF
jgi:hypothetical protein